MTIERLVVPVEWKAWADADLPAEWKEDGADPGTLVGYASTFGNVDLGGDVVVKGAFAKTIRNIKANGIPLLADHTPTVNAVLGTIVDAKEDNNGLLIKAVFSSAQSAQDARIKMREGHVNRMSIGYEPMDWAYEERADGRTVRLLKEIKLWESSVVVFPMNPEAVISRVKSIVESADLKGENFEELKQFTYKLSTQTLQRLASEAKSAVRSESTNPADEAGGSGDEPEKKAADLAATSTDEDEEHEADEAEVKGYDRWRSEAVLNGADPDELADPVTRAKLIAQLELEEEAPIYRNTDPDSRAALARQLADTEGSVTATRRRFSHPS